MFRSFSKNGKIEGEQQTRTDKTETTTTSMQSGTFFDETRRTITHQTTRQTVVHQKQSLVSEIITQQSLSPQLMSELGIPIQTTTTTTIRSPFFLGTEETISQSRGSSVTCNVEEQRITLSPHSSSLFRNMSMPMTNQQFDRPFFQSDAHLFSRSTYSPSSSPALTTFSSKSALRPETNHQNFSVRAQRKSKLSPGIAYIFNNENFVDTRNESREGTEADVNNLVETFQELQLKVKQYKDPTLDKIKNVVKSIVNKDFTDISCCLIVILSHGSRYDTIEAKDKTYSIDDDVLLPITKNPTLCNKPKIFFVQACKGPMEVGNLPTDTNPIGGVPAEILKCYSSFEGYVSFRTAQGSPFILKLCENLKRDGRTKNIEAIMKDVTAAVKEYTRTKQIPTMTVNLTKPFVFGDYMD